MIRDSILKKVLMIYLIILNFYKINLALNQKKKIKIFLINKK